MENQTCESEKKAIFNLEIPIDLSWEIDLELSFSKTCPNDFILEAIRKYLKKKRILRIIENLGYELELSKMPSKKKDIAPGPLNKYDKKAPGAQLQDHNITVKYTKDKGDF